MLKRDMKAAAVFSSATLLLFVLCFSITQCERTLPALKHHLQGTEIEDILGPMKNFSGIYHDIDIAEIRFRFEMPIDSFSDFAQDIETRATKRGWSTIELGPKSARFSHLRPNFPGREHQYNFLSLTNVKGSKDIVCTTRR